MRKNTKNLLLLLFPLEASQVRGVSTKSLSFLLPELTEGGRRSLVHVLEKAGLISTERVAQHTSMYLTDTGKRQLLLEFPALNQSWDTFTGSWDCLVFHKAPVGDPQFRYLRSVLIEQGSLALSRGVYVSPGAFAAAVTDLCKGMYSQSVYLFTIGEWKVGFDRSIITRNFAVADLATAYSGISKEIDDLLAIKSRLGTLNDQQKQQFISVFARFRDLLEEDRGLVAFYYPQVPGARLLLSRLQQIFYRIETAQQSPR